GFVDPVASRFHQEVAMARRTHRRGYEESSSRYDVRKREYRDGDEEGDELVSRVREPLPDGPVVSPIVYCVYSIALSVFAIGALIATFLIYELRGCQIAAIGLIVWWAGLILALYVARQNDEMGHILISVFLAPYWVIFALFYWNRYAAPFIVTV